MKNKQEKNYSVADEFKDLDTKVVSAIREILSITLQIRSPMPSDGIELEFWIGMLETMTMNIELNTIVKLWLDIFVFCPAPKKQNVQENDKRFPVKQKTHQNSLPIGQMGELH